MCNPDINCLINDVGQSSVCLLVPGPMVPFVDLINPMDVALLQSPDFPNLQ